jgi:hypothetical protein
LIKLRPGRAFAVERSPRTPSYPPTSILGHHMLRLWNKRAQIQQMPYLAIIIHNHAIYTPWILLLQKGFLGQVTTSSGSEDEPLIDLGSEESTSASSTSQMATAVTGPPIPAPSVSGTVAPATQPPVNVWSNGPANNALPDSFGIVWEHARAKEKGGQTQKQERMAENSWCTAAPFFSSDCWCARQLKKTYTAMSSGKQP